MSRHEQIADDLHTHLGHRLRRLLTDHADTCRTGGVTNHEFVAMALSAMMFETASAAVVLNLTEDEFLLVCRSAYKHLLESHNEVKSRKKRR